jgi:YVTN family beta-propeller protein
VIFTPTGEKAFVASFGTDRIGVFDAAGNALASIGLTNASEEPADPQKKRGPRALAMHRNGTTLYALNRLSNSVSVVDSEAQRVVAEVMLQDPTPDVIRSGRGYLFDATLSGNGTVSCASCHVDGDRDGLAWDLGDPGGTLFNNGTSQTVHPMKGPLLTQTLRGLAGETMFHWRADRPGLESFNGTFEHLLGGTQLVCR